VLLGAARQVADDDRLTVGIIWPNRGTSARSCAESQIGGWKRQTTVYDESDGITTGSHGGISFQQARRRMSSACSVSWA